MKKNAETRTLLHAELDKLLDKLEVDGFQDYEPIVDLRVMEFLTEMQQDYEVEDTYEALAELVPMDDGKYEVEDRRLVHGDLDEEF